MKRQRSLRLPDQPSRDAFGATAGTSAAVVRVSETVVRARVARAPIWPPCHANLALITDCILINHISPFWPRRRAVFLGHSFCCHCKQAGEGGRKWSTALSCLPRSSAPLCTEAPGLAVCWTLPRNTTPLPVFKAFIYLFFFFFFRVFSLFPLS